MIGFAALTLCCADLKSPDLRLMDVVKRRDAKSFETLLAARVDMNATAPDGASALAWAALLDLSDMAETLLAAGAKVNTVGEFGETPLTLALANGNVRLSKKLLAAGADIKVTRWNGETALMIAAGAGSVDEVRLLLDRGMDVDGAEPKQLQNALMWAASEGHVDGVELLIARGANVSAASKAGYTPLVFAALKNDGGSVERLLKAGANPNFALPDQTKVLTLVVIDAAQVVVSGFMGNAGSRRRRP